MKDTHLVSDTDGKGNLFRPHWRGLLEPVVALMKMVAWWDWWHGGSGWWHGWWNGGLHDKHLEEQVKQMLDASSP